MYKHICEFSAAADTQYLFLQHEKNPMLACFYCVFSSFEFHEYLKLLRFQQVSCPESEVGFFHNTLQNFLTFHKLY